MKSMSRFRRGAPGVYLAIASSGVLVGASAERVLAANCPLSPHPQFFVRSTSSSSLGYADVGATALIERHAFDFSTPGCDYSGGLPGLNTVHVRGDTNQDFIEIGAAQRYSIYGKYARVFTEERRNGNVSAISYRDPWVSETADYVAPCHQTIGSGYTGFKAERVGGQNPDGTYAWQLSMDCGDGGGYQTVHNRYTLFKSGRPTAEFELQYTGMDQYSHHIGLREKVDSTWYDWPGMICNASPSNMSTHVAPSGNSFITNVSGSVC